MGVGNRFKKQGMPEPLDESKVTRKRKDYVPEPAKGANKKRRTSQELPARSAQKKVKQTNGREHAKKSQKNAGRGAKPEDRKPKKVSKPAKEPSPDLDDDSDVADLSGDAIEDPDVMEDRLDGVQVGGLDALESDSEDEIVGDDFDSDSDVVVSDEEERQGMWSEDEDEEDAKEALTAANIEGLSNKLDDEQAEEAEEAAAEMLQTNITGDRPKVLVDGENEEEEEALLAPDLQLLRNRITETVRVLDDFSKLGEEGRSRAEYTGQLLKDICTYYGYSPYLADKLFNLFPPREAFAFFEANETPRPLVIRTNTLRTHRRELAQALINRGVNLEPVGKWTKVGLQIFESQVPLGATPEYLAGHYILQAASSFLPVMALAPQENERVLDMAAAPGGKTTHLAALMRNTGCIFANDANKNRAKGLIGNIHRMGVKNTIVCNYSALEFPKVMGGFDRVLLDAPCSGTGVIAKDQSVKTNKTEKDFLKMPHLQKQLLVAAIDSVDHTSKTGGYIVYSTCSVTVEENEQVVQYALSKRPNVKLVSTGLIFGKEGFTRHMGKIFHPSLNLTRRYYPHSYNVDGFFVAKFKKTGPTKGGVATAAEVKNGQEEIFDQTPILDDEKTEEERNEADDFGGFDEEEDKVFIERAKWSAMRKKGKDPRSLVRVKPRKEKKSEDVTKEGEEKEPLVKEMKEAKITEKSKNSEKVKKTNELPTDQEMADAPATKQAKKPQSPANDTAVKAKKNKSPKVKKAKKGE
ncbi:NOL1/NOP2/sun family putative RNA met [Venturia nashicola]|uniref:Nucleolar protein 2 n=1 Tax=Venturia nashicola TaxID=86259 RepID=A0A4Z1PAY6_9PEZI|nr:NOL1/NOP2/sun family putative RNA met [Venturia nashicola]TLD30100.1 NOL1/NOP2/sun family putative RNA met [Venturia nashicola]